ncbi:MAG: hypothetical protein K6U87_13175 [Firmicutes bacterium]|nr:hypothetical protein [Bacillota bacterium]
MKRRWAMVASAVAMVTAASGCGAARGGLPATREITAARAPAANSPSHNPRTHGDFSAPGPATGTPGASPPAAVYAPLTPPEPAPTPSQVLLQAVTGLSNRVTAPLVVPSAIPTPVAPPGKTAVAVQATILGRTSYQVCLGFVAHRGQALTSDGGEPLFCYRVSNWPTGKAAVAAVEASQPPKPDPRITPAQLITLGGVTGRLYPAPSGVVVEMRIAGFTVEVEGSRQPVLAAAGLLAALPAQAWPQGTGWLWASNQGTVTMSWADGSLQETAQSAALPAAGLVRMAGSLRPLAR